MAMVYCMARPRKNDSERKSADLRIPLTESQKEMLVQVAMLEGIDTATWARPILLQAARIRLETEARDSRPKT